LKESEIKVRVIYADTDAMGIVYHTNYIKWFEMGRTELMRRMDIVYANLESSGCYLPVSEAYCHYLQPARYDDILIIDTKIAYLRRASIRFDYIVKDEYGENVIAEGYTLHAFTDKEGKIVRIPKNVLKKIENMEGEFKCRER
jgi:acyl-CoA thioester hydrolase